MQWEDCGFPWALLLEQPFLDAVRAADANQNDSDCR